MTKRIFALALPLALVGSIAASSAQAATILTVDAGFYRFGLDVVGNPVGARPADGGLLASDGSPFSFTAVDAVKLTIVDLQLSLDRFFVEIDEAIAGSIFSGLTSPQVTGASVGLSVTDALADPRFSRGIFNLGPGTYTVNVIVAEGDALPGSGAIGVSSVPEPSTMALLAFGLAGVRLATRRSARVRGSQI